MCDVDILILLTLSFFCFWLHSLADGSLVIVDLRQCWEMAFLNGEHSRVSSVAFASTGALSSLVTFHDTLFGSTQKESKKG